MDLILAIVLVILIFGFLVFIHEAGHFFAAKLSGVEVTEFAFGFGPKIISKHYKGTDYKINILPLGGYVKMYGDEDPSSFKQDSSLKNDQRTLQSKSIWAKIFVIGAGPAVNFVAAFFIFYFYLMLVGFQPDPILKIFDFNFIGASEEKHLVYVGITEGGVAESSELPYPAYILEVNGKNPENREEFSQILQDHENKEITLKLQDVSNNEVKDYKVNLPPKNEDGRVLLGIYFPNQDKYSDQVYFVDYRDNKLFSGVAHTFNTTIYQMVGLGQVFSKAFQGDTAQLSESVGSPIKVGEYVYSFVSVRDFKNIINLSGLISATLAVMNMLPIPLIDGGEIYLAIFEKVRGKEISDKARDLISKIGLGFILLLGVVVILKDVWQVIISRIF